MAQISRKLWWWTETYGRSRDVPTWIRTLVNARCGTWTTKPAQWASARVEKEPNGITLPPSWEYLLIWHSGQIKGGSVESCTWYWNVDYLLNCVFSLFSYFYQIPFWSFQVFTYFVPFTSEIYDFQANPILSSKYKYLMEVWTEQEKGKYTCELITISKTERLIFTLSFLYL